MAQYGGLPPPPINDQPGSFTWLEWYRQLRDYLGTSGSIPWSTINFAGSSLADIFNKDHNVLDNIQGGAPGERYHLTAEQYASIGSGLHNSLNGLQGGAGNERYHLTQLEYEWVQAGGSMDEYLPLAGGTMTGPITMQGAQGEQGIISMTPDPGTPGSDYLSLDSQDGMILKAPYIVIDTDSPILTMPGPQVGAMVVVAGVDPFGGALLGYQAQAEPAYSVQDTTTTPVIIKSAGSAPITPWVELGLNVILTEDIAAGTATTMFDMVLSNPTNRSGVVEFGFKLNGVELGRDVTQAIPANYNSTVAIAIPLINGYSSGDDIRLVARVTANSNNGFALTMAASPTDVAVFRIYTGGGGGGGESIPVGTLNSFAGSLPIGWLQANGTAVSRVTYADLFSVIGTTWGPGDGSTTFNLPNIQEYTYIGYTSTGAAKAIIVGIKY